MKWEKRNTKRVRIEIMDHPKNVNKDAQSILQICLLPQNYKFFRCNKKEIVPCDATTS